MHYKVFAGAAAFSTVAAQLGSDAFSSYGVGQVESAVESEVATTAIPYVSILGLTSRS